MRSFKVEVSAKAGVTLRLVLIVPFIHILDMAVVISKCVNEVNKYTLLFGLGLVLRFGSTLR